MKNDLHIDAEHHTAKPLREGTERGRFELPLPLRADRFSKPAHSTTLPPLQMSRRAYRIGGKLTSGMATQWVPAVGTASAPAAQPLSLAASSFCAVI